MIRLLAERVEDFLWAPRGEQEPRPVHWLRITARYLYAVVRDLGDGQLTLRAMSLVYTTLMSIVPLLAFSLSILKGFGVHQKIQPQLYAFLAPLGEKGAELTDQIIAFVDNVRGSVLGGVGLVLLVYTAVSMIQKVEDSFNYVWQIQKSRSLARRFSDYLSVILIGPILMFAATGLIASASSSTIAQRLSEIEPFGTTMVLIGELLPFFVVVGVFTFLYSFIPNTKVKLRAAFAGALVAGLAWSAAGKLFAAFVVGSTKYSAIYSSFAIAIIALIWIYVSWLVLLVGAQIAFYAQNPRLVRAGRSRMTLSPARVEQVALESMYCIALGHRDGNAPTLDDIARSLGVAARALDEIISELEKANIVARAESGGLMPARESGGITVADVLRAVRGGGWESVKDDPVESVLEGMKRDAARGHGRITLEELISGQTRPQERE